MEGRRRNYRTGKALQDAELQDGDKRLQDGQSPTETKLDKLEELGCKVYSVKKDGLPQQTVLERIFLYDF